MQIKKNEKNDNTNADATQCPKNAIKMQKNDKVNMLDFPMFAGPIFS